MIALREALLDPEAYLRGSPPIAPARSVAPGEAKVDAKTVMAHAGAAQQKARIGDRRGARLPLPAPADAAGGDGSARDDASPTASPVAPRRGADRRRRLPGLAPPTQPKMNTMRIATPLGYSSRPPRKMWPIVLVLGAAARASAAARSRSRGSGAGRRRWTAARRRRTTRQPADAGGGRRGDGGGRRGRRRSAGSARVGGGRRRSAAVGGGRRRSAGSAAVGGDAAAGSAGSGDAPRPAAARRRSRPAVAKLTIDSAPPGADGVRARRRARSARRRSRSSGRSSTAPVDVRAAARRLSRRSTKQTRGHRQHRRSASSSSRCPGATRAGPRQRQGQRRRAAPTTA